MHSWVLVAFRIESRKSETALAVALFVRQPILAALGLGLSRHGHATKTFAGHTDAPQALPEMLTVPAVLAKYAIKRLVWVNLLGFDRACCFGHKPLPFLDQLKKRANVHGPPLSLRAGERRSVSR
jgi:hypothetical protein